MPTFRVPIREEILDENGRVKESYTRVEHVRAGTWNDARRALINTLETLASAAAKPTGTMIGEVIAETQRGRVRRFFVGRPQPTGGTGAKVAGLISNWARNRQKRREEQKKQQRRSRGGSEYRTYRNDEFAAPIKILMIGAYFAGAKLWDVIARDETEDKQQLARAWGTSEDEAKFNTEKALPGMTATVIGLAGQGLKVADMVLSAKGV